MNNRRLVIDLTPDGQLDAALARAEAAEAEANQLRDGLAAMSERVILARRSASLAENALETARSRWEEAERREKSIFDSAMDMADQRDRLAARVAELEAQAAAQGWRPVTEEPPSLGYYLTVDFYGVCELCYWENDEWQSFDYPGYRPTHWRPLPPPPAAATAEVTPEATST